jgi:CheY-like chemotaxis protein
MARPEDKTVLVVDDEEDVLDYLSTTLRKAGFNVVTARNGNEGLERVREQPPDFISLDLVMPGKSGIRFLYELRRNPEWANIPFVIVTAHSRDALGSSDLDTIISDRTFSGRSIYLEKPVLPERYVQFVCSELGVEYEKSSSSKENENRLRTELESLMADATPEGLQEALRVLRTRK